MPIQFKNQKYQFNDKDIDNLSLQMLLGEIDIGNHENKIIEVEYQADND